MSLLTRLLCVATVLCVGCGADTPTQPSLRANVHPTGSLSFSACGGGLCNFSGEIVNDGPDCADSVRGITRLVNPSNVDVANASWIVATRLRVGEHYLYSGCCFRLTDINAPGTYRTDVSADAVRCR